MLGVSRACGACGLIHSEPSVDTDALYDAGYFAANYAPLEAAQRERAREHLALLRTFTAGHTLLDYGCGTGIFLEAARTAGFTRAIGVDVSAAAREAATARLGSGAELHATGDDVAGGWRADVIAFVDSLAHVAAAGDRLAALVRERLAPGGLVFVRTPNVTRRQRAYMRLLARVVPERGGDRLYGLPKRYLLFDETSLPAFLAGAGLEVVHLATEREYAPSAGAHLLYDTIPRRLSPDGSLVAVARAVRAS